MFHVKLSGSEQSSWAQAALDRPDPAGRPRCTGRHSSQAPRL